MTESIKETLDSDSELTSSVGEVERTLDEQEHTLGAEASDRATLVESELRRYLFNFFREIDVTKDEWNMCVGIINSISSEMSEICDAVNNDNSDTDLASVTSAGDQDVSEQYEQTGSHHRNVNSTSNHLQALIDQERQYVHSDILHERGFPFTRPLMTAGMNPTPQNSPIINPATPTRHSWFVATKSLSLRLCASSSCAPSKHALHVTDNSVSRTMPPDAVKLAAMLMATTIEPDKHRPYAVDENARSGVDTQDASSQHVTKDPTNAHRIEAIVTASTDSLSSDQERDYVPQLADHYSRSDSPGTDLYETADEESNSYAPCICAHAPSHTPLRQQVENGVALDGDNEVGPADQDKGQMQQKDATATGDVDKVAAKEPCKYPAWKSTATRASTHSYLSDDSEPAMARGLHVNPSSASSGMSKNMARQLALHDALTLDGRGFKGCQSFLQPKTRYVAVNPQDVAESSGEDEDLYDTEY